MKSRVSAIKEKQLKNKVEAINSMPQLKDIYKNVLQQNITLRQDILNLRYKVDLLLEKQKAKNSYVSKEDQAKGKEISALRTDLREQYKIMQQLKKQKQQGQTQKGTDQLNQQLFHLTNKLRTLDNQLSEIKIEILDLKNQGEKLEKSVNIQEEQDKRNQPKIASFSSENNLLRKKILSLRKLSNEKQFQSAKIMNSMYSIKIKVNKNQTIEKEIQTQRYFPTQQQKARSKSQVLQLQQLSKEVSELKKEMQRKEQQMNKNQLIALRRKEELMNENKESLAKQKDLSDKKTKLLRQLNKYNKIWERHLELKNNNKSLKEYGQMPIQISQYINPLEPLRRQFAGVLGGKIRFDDRLALKNNLKSFIIGFIVYELEVNTTSKNALVAFRGIYDDPEANFNNQVPIPGQYLSKCKIRKYMLMQGDFIKLFKIKYQSIDSHILKIEIRTNKNNRYQFGDKHPFSDLNPGENVYGFDIAIEQYPVCLFGSYNYLKSQWYLESLGVEINELSN